MFKIVVPGKAQPSTCGVTLRDLPQAERDAVADEMGALGPSAVTPGWVRDYLKLRVSVREACAS